MNDLTMNMTGMTPPAPVRLILMIDDIDYVIKPLRDMTGYESAMFSMLLFTISHNRYYDVDIKGFVEEHGLWRHLEAIVKDPPKDKKYHFSTDF